MTPDTGPNVYTFLSNDHLIMSALQLPGLTQMEAELIKRLEAAMTELEEMTPVKVAMYDHTLTTTQVVEIIEQAHANQPME